MIAVRPRKLARGRIMTIVPRIAGGPGAPPHPASTSSGPLPASVDLRGQGFDGPVKDQQQAGVCWSFALSTVMDNALRRAGRTEVMAPLHIVADDEYRVLYTQGSGR